MPDESGPLLDQRRYQGDQENISHPPSGLFQRSSQLDSVRRLARKLYGCGAKCNSTEFSGGHDPACWAKELPNRLDVADTKRLTMRTYIYS